MILCLLYTLIIVENIYRHCVLQMHFCLWFKFSWTNWMVCKESCDSSHHLANPLLEVYFAGTYIAVEVCICAFSVVMQIIILNMYHARGDRAVPACLMVIARRHKGTKIGTVRQNDVSDQDPAPDNSQIGSDVEHRKRFSTPQESRERADAVLGDTASEMVKEDWRFIARMCDIICFVLFFMFHALLVIIVIFLLLN